MLTIALGLAVPTVAIAWWSSVVARRARGARWVAPVVIGAWIATTTLALVSLVMAFRASSTAEIGARARVLTDGIVNAVDLIVVMVAVLVLCAVATAVSARRAPPGS
jgi:hypothetical protein